MLSSQFSLDDSKINGCSRKGITLSSRYSWIPDSIRYATEQEIPFISCFVPVEIWYSASAGPHWRWMYYV